MTPVTSFELHRADARERLRASGIVRPGPGSVSWQINREILVVAGWGRAILLQLAHPLVAAGIDGHSNFRGGLSSGIKRLRSTIGAMLSLTFGSDEEAIAAAAGINVIHDRVSGSLSFPAGRFPAGARYSAHHAELLRWVHATLVDSIPRTYELLVGSLTDAEQEHYCVDVVVMEPLLDIPTGLLPRSRADLDTYMSDILCSCTMAVTDGSRRLARAVLFPPGWRLVWPVFRPVQLITIGLLPSAVRHAYGFEWTDRDARALVRWTTVLKFLLRVTPAVFRHWPASRKHASIATPTPLRPLAKFQAGSLLVELITQRLARSEKLTMELRQDQTRRERS